MDTRRKVDVKYSRDVYDILYVTLTRRWKLMYNLLDLYHWNQSR